MKKLLSSLFLVSSLSAYAADAPHNIIMVVADGMGPEYVTAYRYYNDDPQTTQVERTIFDKHLKGLASTYPARISGYVTDSAAAATALATGHKSYNGAISVDVNKKPLESVLERAKKLGYKTGAVVTSQVNHATPASYLAHNEYRRNYNEIADSYIDEKINNKLKFDVLLGGGQQYFIRKDRNIIKEMKALGVQYIDSYQQLSTLNDRHPAIGLFAEIGLPYALDDSNKHRLKAMAKTATGLLENNQGYFLLIEASQVDWAGHSNDIASAMGEMEDLAATMIYLEQYVANHPNTTVILTADHSTGGLTLAANSKYLWEPAIMKKLSMSPKGISDKLTTEHASNNKKALLEKLLGFTVTDKELALVNDAQKNIKEKKAAYDLLTAEQKKQNRPVHASKIIEKAIKKIIDQRTTTGWTTGGHTAIDVPVIALGEHANMFNGHIDNTQIAKNIFKLLATYSNAN